MSEFSYTISDEIGIHARPAGLLVKAAAKFDSVILIENTENGKIADAKRLFAVMGLEAKCGNKMSVRISGPDEAEAKEFLEDFFKNNL